MNNKIMVSLVAAFAIGIIGCGSNGSKKVDDNNTPPSDIPNNNTLPGDTPNNNNKPPVTVIERDINSEFIMPSRGLETRDYGKYIEVSKNNTNGDIYLSFDHNDKGKRVLFYIDADNNISTGSTVFQGADILVSSYHEKKQDVWEMTKQLWRPNDTNLSQWKEDNNATKDIAYNSGVMKDIIWLKPNLVIGDYFTVTAQAADTNWNSKLDSDTVAFDIRLANSGNPQTITGTSSLSMEIDSDSTSISLKLLGDEYNKYTQILIDVDENNETGENTSHWKNLGADYIISEGYLYKRTDTDWGWDTGKKLPYVIKDNSLNYSIKKSDLENLGNSIVAGVAIYNNSNYWPVAHSIPETNASTDVPVYTLN